MSSPLGPVEQESYKPETWTESITHALPSFIVDSFTWLGQKVGYLDPLERHLQVILHAPNLAALPEIEEEKRKPTAYLTPIEGAIDILATAAGRAASISSSTKDYQVKKTRAIATELLEKAVLNLVEDLTITPTKADEKAAAEIVQKLAQTFAKTLLKETIPPPTYTESPHLERAVKQLVKPVLESVFKKLLELDEKGAIRDLIDRLVIQLDNHVTALKRNSFSLQDFQDSKEPGCHRVVSYMPYEGVNDPSFREDLRDALILHFDRAINTFFGKSERADLFKALYQTRGSWLKELAPDFVGNGVVSKLIEDESHFVRIAECAYQFYSQEYGDLVLAETGSALIDFTEPQNIKGILYGAALPPVINLLKETILTKSYSEAMINEGSPNTRLTHLSLLLQGIDVEEDVLADIKSVAQSMAPPLDVDAEIIKAVLEKFKKLPRTNDISTLQAMIKNPSSPVATGSIAETSITSKVASNAPAAFGHLVNQLLFGVILQTPGASFMGKMWEGRIANAIASGISFVRDDPLPFVKILTLAYPAIESSLTREKLYKMMTTPPKEGPSPEKQLDELADLLVRVAKIYLPESVVPAKETIYEAIRTRIDMLFDAQWKNINLLLVLGEAFQPTPQPDSKAS